MAVPVWLHAKRRFAAEAELQRRFRSDASLAYWQWLMGAGWSHDDELRRLLPLPPYPLMARTAGAHSTDSTFHDGGVVDAASMYQRLIEGGFAPAPGAHLLDFGCGPGRLLRPWSRFADEVGLYGVDADGEAIEWVRQNLPWARAEPIAPTPPLPFPDAQFDAAFAFAVLSQLAEPLQRTWLAELARVLRADGVLVITTHGTHCAERFASGAVTLFPFPAAARIAADLAQLAAQGSLYYPYPEADERCLPANLRGTGQHGVAFVTRAHVEAHWLHDFTLVAHHAAPRGFLDEIVLRRRERRHDRGGASPGPNND